MSFNEPKPIDYAALWKHVTGASHHSPYSVHGPDHWKRVERNGLILATRTGADITVIRLFALFHDSRRENDGYDEGHGSRGAAYAQSLRSALFHVTDDQFELLHFACTWHTDRDHHEDSTIGTCWDADRLDLGRVGIIPSAKYMNTAFAKEIADYGSIYPWQDLAPPDLHLP